MITLSTAAIIAIVFEEPEAEDVEPVLQREEIVIGLPTLLDRRTVFPARRFSSLGDIVARFSAAPNIAAVPFDAEQYRTAEQALRCYGKGRHPAGLKMGNYLSYAGAAIAEALLLFKRRGFSRTDLNLRPAASVV